MSQGAKWPKYILVKKARENCQKEQRSKRMKDNGLKRKKARANKQNSYIRWNFSIFASADSFSFAFSNACSSSGYVIRA